MCVYYHRKVCVASMWRLLQAGHNLPPRTLVFVCQSRESVCVLCGVLCVWGGNLVKKKVKLKTYFFLGRNRVTFLIFSRTLFLLFILKSFFLHIYHLYQLSRRAGPEKPANPQGLYKIPRKMSHVTYSHIKIYIYLHVCNLSKYYWEWSIILYLNIFVSIIKNYPWWLSRAGSEFFG